MPQDISPDVLRQLLRYEPETGKLFWLARPLSMFENARHCAIWNTSHAGREAFITKKDGYRVGSIFDRKYRAHRVIWAMETGKWPQANVEIDHRDRDRGNNRWGNLREATSFSQKGNVTSAKGSSSRYLGVTWHKQMGKWQAQISAGGRKTSLGLFVVEEDAARAYDLAAIEAYGEFANPNFGTVPK